MRTVPTPATDVDVPHRDHYAHKAVSNALAFTEDGSSVVMRLGETNYSLSARQADAIAQGLLMALLRTGLDIDQMPWTGGLEKVTRYEGIRSPLIFSDDTWYGANPIFAFFGVCWLYEGIGEDPDYPANALCIQGLHDGAILFNKGNETFLLTFEQAFDVCVSLSDSAYSLEQRGWRIWDRLIEWRKPVGQPTGEPTEEERALFKHLEGYPKRMRREKRRQRKSFDQLYQAGG